MNLIRLEGAELTYGTHHLLDHADFSLHAGEKVALVGRNGSGKSTLMKVLADEIALEDGTRWTTPGLSIARLRQDVPEGVTDTLFDVVRAGLGSHADPSASVDGDAAWNSDYRVERMLDQFDLARDLPLNEGSGGIRRRALLAQALVSEPQVLLLDEPTNHLDVQSIDTLQQLLANTTATLVFVSHDRALIGAVATRIVELDRGKLTSYPGQYAAYLEKKAEAEEIEARANRKFDKNLAQEEAWIREGIKARRTRNEGRVRRLQALRKSRESRVDKTGNVNLALDSGEQSGAIVSVLDDVTFGYEAPLIRNFSTRIMRGDRIGIIGPNGSGKSTLIRLILGELTPQQGQVTLGSKLEVAYLDQQRTQIDGTRTVRDNVSPGSDQVHVGGKTRHIIGYLADFLFPASYANMPASKLSGGEKNRLLMAQLFTQPANLLVLDEPTNDLDVETLELFEELIADYAGTILLVSHDRAFLDAVVTSTMVIGANGTVREYVGGYSDWHRQAAATTDTPTRASKPTAKSGDSNASSSKPESKKSRAPDNRLSYNERRELNRLPAQIEKLEAKQTEMQAQVSESGFYQQDDATVKAALADLETVGAEIEAAYERWESLAAREE